MATVDERFWSKVDRASSDECWIWNGSTGERGYGRFWYEGRQRQAHHVAWLLTKGEIPEGLMACHTCDNPPCVNPGHIFWGTMSDNIVDAVKATAVLVWLVYGETGWATATFAALMALGMEANALILRIHRERLDAQIDRIRDLTPRTPRLGSVTTKSL